MEKKNTKWVSKQTDELTHRKDSGIDGQMKYISNGQKVRQERDTERDTEGQEFDFNILSIARGHPRIKQGNRKIKTGR